MNRNHFITGRLEQDELIGSKAFTDRKAALEDLRQRARVSKVIDWREKESFLLQAKRGVGLSRKIEKEMCLLALGNFLNKISST